MKKIAAATLCLQATIDTNVMKIMIATLFLSVSIAPVYSKVLDIEPKGTFYLGALSEYLKKPIGKVRYTETKDACPVVNPVTGEHYTGQCLKGLNTVLIGQTHKLEHFLTANDTKAREDKYYKHYFPNSVALSFGHSPRDTSSIFVITPTQ